MGVWLATHCVWVSGTTAANSHSLNRTGRQQRRVRSQYEEGRHIHTHETEREDDGMEEKDRRWEGGRGR